MNLAFLIRNKTTILIILIVIMAGALSVSIRAIQKQKKIASRWENNYRTEIKTFNDNSGLMAARVQETQLTLRELRQSSDSTINDLFQKVKDFGIRNRELEQLLQIKTIIKYDSVFIPIVDTIIIRPLDTITRLADYKSKWLDVSLFVDKTRLEVLDYECRDEILISVNWFKDRKFFIRRWFEPKKWEANVKSMNPNTNISYLKNIRVTKKIGR